MQLPDELDANLLEILGRPNFMCGDLAVAMRGSGTAIPRKSEAEQAHVLFMLLSLYAQHGETWREKAADWIDGMFNQIRTEKLAAIMPTAPHPHP